MLTASRIMLGAAASRLNFSQPRPLSKYDGGIDFAFECSTSKGDA